MHVGVASSALQGSLVAPFTCSVKSEQLSITMPKKFNWALIFRTFLMHLALQVHPSALPVEPHRRATSSSDNPAHHSIYLTTFRECYRQNVPAHTERFTNSQWRSPVFDASSEIRSDDSFHNLDSLEDWHLDLFPTYHRC